jgi:hypothetical protein
VEGRTRVIPRSASEYRLMACINVFTLHCLAINSIARILSTLKRAKHKLKRLRSFPPGRSKHSPPGVSSGTRLRVLSPGLLPGI